eukprot:1177170-Prorocentrum_minimum.AAC.2
MTRQAGVISSLRPRNSRWDGHDVRSTSRRVPALRARKRSHRAVVTPCFAFDAAAGEFDETGTEICVAVYYIVTLANRLGGHMACISCVDFVGFRRRQILGRRTYNACHRYTGTFKK